jgi:ankyrin repeat protein
MLAGASSVFAAGAKDVDARRPDGSTPLQWAAFAGDVDEARRLIAAGADVRATSNYGVNAMLLAADIASTELIQLLLKNGADANSANPDGETALHLVSRAGNIEAAKLLLKAGAKVDPREKLGQQTPLMWAVARRHPEMVEFLLSQGAAVNARSAVRDYQRVATAESRAKSLDRGGLTPLLYAARENCRECVDILLKHGADVNLPDPTNVVPMVIAMVNGNFDIAKRLIEAGADVNQWDIFGQAPLHVAIGGGGRSGNPLDADFPQKATSADITQMLLDRGANPNQQTYYRPAVRGAGGRGTTPFLVAVGTGNIDLVKQLIAKGANVKLATSEGQGAIHAAAQARAGGGGGAPGGLAPGGGGARGGGPPGGGAPGGPPGGGAAAADGTDSDGTEPGAAGPSAPAAAPRAATGAEGFANTLAGAQAPGGARGGGGPGAGRGPGAAPAGAPAGAAAANRPNPQVELIKLLAAEGADVNLMARRHFLQRSRGGSALHYVVRGGGNKQVIQALLDLGLDINAKDEDGLTALDYAMGRGYVPFLQMAQPANKALADYLRSVGATVELDRIPDWPPQGAPIATVVYDSVIWPVDPVGP